MYTPPHTYSLAIFCKLMFLFFNRLIFCKMKKNLLTKFAMLVCCIALSTSMFAQNPYYWADGKKIDLTEDRSSLIIQFQDFVSEAQLEQRLLGKAAVREIELHPVQHRAIVHFNQPQSMSPENLLADLNLDNFRIRSAKFGYTLNDGFQLWLTHRLVLRLRRGVDVSALDGYIDGEQVRFHSELYGNILLEVKDPQLALTLSNTLEAGSLVEYAHPDFYAPAKRNDPLYPQQFQMNNTGQTIDGFTGVADIDVDGPEAWALTTGSSTLVVAVIDDGVENHEDLNDGSGASRLIGGYTPLNGGNGLPNSSGAHGQACAGIIAASHNGVGVRGVAPQVKLLSVNIFAGNESATDIANGINWAVNNGADVLSNSWGYTSCTANFSVLTNAINSATTNGRGGKGCVVIFASGNGYKSCVDYPANLSSVVAVGAVTNQGVRSAYSNYGTDLDIVAPSNGAAGVRTIDRMGSPGYSSGNYTNTFGGTSAACPVVAGVAALVLSVDPNLTQSEVKDIMYSTADDMGPTGFDTEYANGRVNAHQSVLAAQGGGGGGGGGPTYCASQGNNATFEWISNVSLGSFSNNSGSAGYTDFTNLTVSVNAGQTYTASVTPSFSGSTYQEYVRIWIDLNQDGDFTDPGEEVFAAGPSASTMSGPLTIPSTALSGDTRMRVSMKWNAVPGPCEVFAYGEVEDYTINISPAAPTCTTPAGLNASNITTTDAVLSWGAVSGASSYDLRVRVAGPNSWTNFNGLAVNSISLTGFTPNTAYEFSVRTNCTNGVSSNWSSNFGFTTLPLAPTYCSAGGNNSSYEWIDLVQLTNVSNPTGNNGGYGDYTNLVSSVVRGNSVTVYYSKGSTGNYRAYWRIYIDWNQDGDFLDSGELIVSRNSTSSGTLSTTFAVPTGAVLGQTRMRVMMKYGSYPTSCETYTYGETEDYTLNVTSSGPTQANFPPQDMALEADSDDSPYDAQLQLSPNPATDYIDLRFETRDPVTRILVIDQSGRHVQNLEGNFGTSAPQRLQVQDLPPGMYTVQVITDHERLTQRFVKVR